MLGFVSGVRHREEELGRAFFSARFVRVLDSLGYTTFRRWRVYGEEALAGREAALWLAAESLTVEHSGETLSRYEAKVEEGTGRLRSVGGAELFETSYRRDPPQQRLFGLAALGEDGWLKALRLRGYAPRSPRRPRDLQQALFPYQEAWGSFSAVPLRESELRFEGLLRSSCTLALRLLEDRTRRRLHRPSGAPSSSA